MHRRTALFAVALLVVMSLLPGAPTYAQDPDAQATISALQTQVAQLSTPQPTEVIPEATAPAEATPASQPPSPTSVNVEFILDVSGSMGQFVDTGETRLDAAKRVLTEVVAAIPDQPGINVGLRIYGHEGDNTESGRPVSCLSSDLVVPINGIDRSAIEQRMAPLAPTGWTPIGLSLERSEADFLVNPDGTNAVVLVTDGLETCGGDPAAVAAALSASERRIVTHVIGFALTPEEQQILQAITDASGGKLLEANNATQLTGALFTILNELDVVKGAGFIGGTALSLLPQGDPGELSVVAVGAYDGNILPFVVRNNTGEAVISLSATGKALNSAGQLIGTGGDQMLNPNLLRAGGLSMGYIYFGGAVFPADTTFLITVTGTPAAQEKFENQRDLEVVEAALVDGRVVGTLRNGYEEPLNGPFGVQVACFDTSGGLTYLKKVYTPEQHADAGAQATFQATFFEPVDCSRFLLAGGGFSQSFRTKASAILTPQAPGPASPNNAILQDTVDPEPAAPTATLAPQALVVATPGPNGCYDLDTALGVLSGLQAQGIPIGEFENYTPETDPNELMGRPGGYTSKVNFRDTRLVPKTVDFSTEDGGSIEVFATPENLESRVAHLKASWEAFPIVPKDVLFSEGTVLLRVSSRLLIPDGEAYGAALDALAACN
jgi:hypothetical protein